MYVVDSNVFIGAFNPRDAYHKEASAIILSIDKGEVGESLITDHILDEILTFVRRKVGYEKSMEVLNSILSSKYVKIVTINEKAFRAAFIIFEKYPRLSFTDSVTVAYMYTTKLTGIVSFDSGFDGVEGIERLTTFHSEKT